MDGPITCSSLAPQREEHPVNNTNTNVFLKRLPLQLLVCSWVQIDMTYEFKMNIGKLNSWTTKFKKVMRHIEPAQKAAVAYKCTTRVVLKKYDNAKLCWK
jgi:hypothetical protein